MKRFKALDGWRGISIVLVLAAHLLPLGPGAWEMNATIGRVGMVIFFILSGFLITSLLLKKQNILSFLIRRLMRILPLAWLATVVLLAWVAASPEQYFSHLLFYANLQDAALTARTAHFWSLCLEVQFYFFIAALVAVFRRRALFLLPILSLLVTGYRLANGVESSIHTLYRIDEILAGCTLALLYSANTPAIHRFFKSLNPIVLLPLLVIAGHPDGGVMNYLRPYLAMMMVGATLFREEEETWWNRVLASQPLFYLASVSYAVYIVHGGLMAGWLFDGETTLIKYAKRPLILLITFAVAHFSTFYYENYWMGIGKQWSKQADVFEERLRTKLAGRRVKPQAPN